MNSLREPETVMDEYHETTVQVAFWTLQIITYRLDSKFVCIVNNLDPGATICREVGDTRKGVQKQALARANEYLAKTVSSDVGTSKPEAIQLARIVLTSVDPPRNYTIAEFLGISIQERMNYVLGGGLTFYDDYDREIPAGTAMTLLAHASA